MRLTDIQCKSAKFPGKPAKLTDGQGLYLLVTATGKLWRYDYRFAGKRKTASFGAYPSVSLAEARRKHAEARAKVHDSVDPMTERKAAKLARTEAALDTFETVAREWFTDVSRRWSKSTSDKTIRRLERDAFPKLGTRPIKEIAPREVQAVLEAVCKRGAAYSAGELRSDCTQIFRWAMRFERADRDPAGLVAGTIDIPPTRHRPALTDPRSFGAFLRDLNAYAGADPVTILAARLAILSFVRSAELRHATWDEVDFEASEWRIPAGRMKMAKGSNQSHVVPLSPQAVAILRKLYKLTGIQGGYLFPGLRGANTVMSENTIGFVLKKMGYQGRQSLHGFRASARSMLAERGWSEVALERQLDHAETRQTVASYARSQHMDERRKLMADWGACVAAMENDRPLPRRVA